MYAGESTPICVTTTAPSGSHPFEFAEEIEQSALQLYRVRIRRPRRAGFDERVLNGIGACAFLSTGRQQHCAFGRSGERRRRTLSVGTRNSPKESFVGRRLVHVSESCTPHPVSSEVSCACIHLCAGAVDGPVRSSKVVESPLLVNIVTAEFTLARRRRHSAAGQSTMSNSYRSALASNLERSFCSFAKIVEGSGLVFPHISC